MGKRSAYTVSSYSEPEPKEIADEPVTETVPEAMPVVNVSETAIVDPETHPADIVSLRVFATLAGIRWDQLAGFVSHATRTQMGPMTVAAWHAAYQTFQGKPIG